MLSWLVLKHSMSQSCCDQAAHYTRMKTNSRMNVRTRYVRLTHLVHRETPNTGTCSSNSMSEKSVCRTTSVWHLGSRTRFLGLMWHWRVGVHGVRLLNVLPVLLVQDPQKCEYTICVIRTTQTASQFCFLNPSVTHSPFCCPQAMLSSCCTLEHI